MIESEVKGLSENRLGTVGTPSCVAARAVDRSPLRADHSMKHFGLPSDVDFAGAIHLSTVARASVPLGARNCAVMAHFELREALRDAMAADDRPARVPAVKGLAPLACDATKQFFLRGTIVATPTANLMARIIAKKQSALKVHNQKLV